MITTKWFTWTYVTNTNIFRNLFTYTIIIAEISLFAQALLKKIGLKELALTAVLLGRSFLLLMSLLVLTKLALMGLHGGTLLLQMGLPGQTELVLTTVIMDL